MVGRNGSIITSSKKCHSRTKQKEGKRMSTVSIRYMIDDVPVAVKFYTTHLAFEVEQDASPAFASVTRDGVRLLLSGKTSSGRRAMPDGREPVPGGWNRIHIQVEDPAAEVSSATTSLRGRTARKSFSTTPPAILSNCSSPNRNPETIASCQGPRWPFVEMPGLDYSRLETNNTIRVS